MLNLTKSVLSCVSLSTVLSLGACGDTEPQFRQTAQFSQASEDEIEGVAMMVELASLASVGIPLVAFITAGFSENGCPAITETGVAGNGCVASDGSRFEGSLELVENEVDGFSSVIYRGFRFPGPEFAFYMDGSVVFAQESEETVRYDLALTVEIQLEPGAEPQRGEAEMSAICDVLEGGTAHCTLEAGSAAKLEGLGGFTMEGVHGLGFPSGETNDSNASDVLIQGAESLHYVYDGGAECYTYTIEGGEPQRSCKGE
jgi:hypothetical protein